MSYHNPDGVIEEEKDGRTITMRFATQEDLDDFVKLTNLSVNSKTKTYKFSAYNPLEDLFV